MRVIDSRLVAVVGLTLALVAACKKKETAATPGTIDTAVPAVAVTTEVAPGVLMTVEAGPGTGLVLVDGNGRAMYVLDKAPTDTTVWKPVSGSQAMTTTDANVNKGLIGTTTANGTSQATYAGKPLYYYSGDAAAGDRKGQGATASGTTGHLVSPAGGSAGATRK